MNAYIDEVHTRINAVPDGDSPLSPRMMEHIIQTVCRAVRQELAHDERVMREHRITSGVRDEIEGEA